MKPRLATAALEGWTAEWVGRRRAAVIAEFEALPDRAAAAIGQSGCACTSMSVAAHPSIRKRLQTHGWKHQLVLGEFIKFYRGADWDKPGPQDLLAIAAEQSGRAR